MAKQKKITDEKEIEKKLSDLKIEILKQPQKKKRIKKEIARLLTMTNARIKEKNNEANMTKLGGKK